jgi:hypothetical protein
MARTTKTATAKPDASPRAPRPAKGAKQPVKMTDALFEEICVRIANGSMLMQLEKEEGGDRFPSRTTILNWVNAAPERREQYEMARADQADYFADRLVDVNAKLEEGKIDPASARALSDNLKWSAKVGRPERYGDRSQVELNVSRTEAAETTDELRARVLKTIGSLPLLPEANDAKD